MSLTQLSDRTQVAEDVIKDLTGRLSKMETANTEQIGRILKIEEDVGNGPDITNEDLRIIRAQQGEGAELLAGCAGLAPDTSPYTFSKTPMDVSDTIGTQKENQSITEARLISHSFHA